MHRFSAVAPITKGIWLWLLLFVAASPQMCGEIRVLAVTSSAGFARGFPRPGSLATLFCTGLAGINGVFAAPGAPLPRTLAGVRVTFFSVDPIQAPLLAVADLGGYQQINFQVPWEVGQRAVFPGGALVTVSQGDNSAVVSDGLAPWGQFFVDPAGYVIAQHAADYRLLTADNPARPGEWIVAYGSNFGAAVWQPSTGEPAPLDQLSPLDPGVPAPWQFSLFLRQPGGDIRLATNFIGLAPGAVGVYQANFRMPDAIASGDAPFYVQRFRDCGFFFRQDCGRGITLEISARPNLHIGGSGSDGR